MRLRRLHLVAAGGLICAVLAGARLVLGQAAGTGDGSITLRIIVVGTGDAAARVLERVAAGEDFAAVARDSSTAPSAADGGWLGPLPVSQLRPDVRDALQGLKPGAITRAIHIPTGFAIFKVENVEAPNRPAAPVAISQAIASSGAVRFVYDLSGFSEARAALASLTKPDNWNLDPRAICDARNRALATTHAAVDAYLAPDNAAARARQPAINLMQIYVGLAQIDSYEGHMDRAVAHFQEAYRIATTSVPNGIQPLDEALGIAYLQKAAWDNAALASPGDHCLLPVEPGLAYRHVEALQRAIDHFGRCLRRKPDDLEVRWLLNVAYMEMGAYPAGVPAAYRIPPAAFASTEGVGRFRDVAPAAGLDRFGMAGGVVVEDLRDTGRFDVVTSSMDSCGPLRLFGNNGDGTFTDRTAAAGLDGQLGGLNVVPGDYNNDGCQDLLVLRGGWEYLPQRKSLLRNNCNGSFTDVTASAGLTVPTTTQTAVWTDVDNDGYLDLFVGNETGPAQLFHNKGNGTFEDVAPAAGVARSSFSKGVTAGDYDNDGWPDLYVSNYGQTNFLYHNNHDGTFTEVASAAHVTGTPTGFATWFFDYDNDGWPDLFVTSYVASIDEQVRDYLHLPHNGTTTKLYRNLGNGTFRDVSAEAGLTRVLMPMGANYGDIDNDGFLDVYLGTGQPSYAAIAGSVLLRNRAGKTFVDVTASSGTGELHKGHGVAFADMDNDGDEDLVFLVGGATRGDRHAMRLFENPGRGNDWIALQLVGVKTNRTAVGARITVTATDAAGATRVMHRTVSTGGSFGASPLVQHVGLGPGVKAVELDIWWPTSRTRQHFTGVEKNTWLRIQELADAYTTLSRPPVVLGGAHRPS